MKFSERTGLNWLEVVAPMTIVLVFAGILFLVGHAYRRDYAKEHFGVTINWDLPEKEKELLKPMVASRLKLMMQDYNEAMNEAIKAESEFFNEKDSITPGTADGLLEKFREAKEQNNSRRDQLQAQLEQACVVAKYFELADTNHEWCK